MRRFAKRRTAVEETQVLTEVYVDNMHNDRAVRAIVRKHPQGGDDDTEYAIAEGGQLFIGCKSVEG